jgi:hypothetical protein
VAGACSMSDSGFLNGESDIASPRILAESVQAHDGVRHVSLRDRYWFDGAVDAAGFFAAGAAAV